MVPEEELEVVDEPCLEPEEEPEEDDEEEFDVREEEPEDDEEEFDAPEAEPEGDAAEEIDEIKRSSSSIATTAHLTAFDSRLLTSMPPKNWTAVVKASSKSMSPGSC